MKLVLRFINPHLRKYVSCQIWPIVWMMLYYFYIHPILIGLLMTDHLGDGLSMWVSRVSLIIVLIFFFLFYSLRMGYKALCSGSNWNEVMCWLFKFTALDIYLKKSDYLLLMRGSSFNFATIMVVLSTETKCWYPLLLLKLYLLIHYFTVWALIGWTSEASSNAFHICLARALLIQLFPTAFTIWCSLNYVNYFCLPLKILKVSNHCYLQFYTLRYDKWNCIFI